jgi:hypothetical protein
MSEELINNGDEGKDLTSGNKSIRINHKELANTLLKFINVTPMPAKLKVIMSCKIINPGMTNMQVALKYGYMVDEVNELESDGKKIVTDYMNRMSTQDAIDKFNKDETVRKAVEELRLPANPDTNNVTPQNANPDDLDRLAE